MTIFSITFANPWAWGLLLIPAIMAAYWIYLGSGHSGSFRYTHSMIGNGKSWRVLIRQYMPWIPIVASIFLVIAIARPQSSDSQSNSHTQGIDIILAMDVSTSMLEADFSPNRLEASKKVAEEFVEKRPNDRIGVVVFSGESFTLCPPTIDHNIVVKQLKAIKNGLIEDGTAIGMGIATSVRALQNSNAKSKVVILLTDGVNTAGTIDPMTAIDIAKAMNTKVYCIGVGTAKGNLLGIDEPLMNRIAKQTGGVYYRAGSNQRLQQIYDEINTLETSEIEIQQLQRKNELFLPWAMVALVLIIAFIILKYWIVRSIVD